MRDLNETTRPIAQGDLFQKACELAHVQPTHRQVKKWQRGQGAAFAKRNEAKALLKEQEVTA